MRRILLSCATLGVIMLLPAAASARAPSPGKPGFLVVRNAADDGGVNGRPAVTLVVHGFVLGSVGQQDEATIDVIQLPSKGGQGAPTATGQDGKVIRWHGFTGHEFNGSGFRFRALDGYYRVVVRGSGVYLFAGGVGNVKLRGSSFEPRSDGKYSVDGGPFRSLPSHSLRRHIGRA